jgi:hypothetical protein
VKDRKENKVTDEIDLTAEQCDRACGNTRKRPPFPFKERDARTE